MQKQYNIGVVGLWHLGCVYSSGLAELGHTVVAFDPNEKTIQDLQNAKPPMHEVGLPELMQKHIASENLRYTARPEDLSSCDVVWLTMDTPIDENGKPNVQAVKDLLLLVLPHIPTSIHLVVSSQMPIGSSEDISAFIKEKRPELVFSYIYQPENLQLGSALKSFFEPGRVVVGVNEPEDAEFMKEIFAPLKTQVQVLKTASSEMTKHALNAFLGTSLSFIYDIASICDAYGADVMEVSAALRSDPRIGPGAYLDASLGFSGGTLDRDLSVLMEKAEQKGKTIPVIASASNKNKQQFFAAVEYLEKQLGNFSDKTIGILGLTYKPGTSTLRHSLSLKLMKELAERGGSIRCHDPLADKQEVEACGPYQFFSDPITMLQGCHAIILMTSCPEYKELDFAKISDLLQMPKMFIDGKNFLAARENEIQSAGIHYHGIGRGK
jgi:UDPglucose 6-dehydrogenase